VLKSYIILSPIIVPLYPKLITEGNLEKSQMWVNTNHMGNQKIFLVEGKLNCSIHNFWQAAQIVLKGKWILKTC
jgi:hypothetical protein